MTIRLVGMERAVNIATSWMDVLYHGDAVVIGAVR
jgi:hypothetical protein